MVRLAPSLQRVLPNGPGAPPATRSQPAAWASSPRPRGRKADVCLQHPPDPAHGHRKADPDSVWGAQPDRAGNSASWAWGFQACGLRLPPLKAPPPQQGHPLTQGPGGEYLSDEPRLLLSGAVQLLRRPRRVLRPLSGGVPQLEGKGRRRASPTSTPTGSPRTASR